MRRTTLAFCLFLIVTMSPSFAGPCDCNIVYDEFDSLMNKEFLLNPEHYVPTVKKRLSREDYNTRQKGIFLLRGDRSDLGIAVVHTNNNTWGKILFSWGAPFDEGHPSLILSEVVLYGRVRDGHAPRIQRDIIIPSSYKIDLDTGRMKNSGNAADLWFHNVDGKTMYIEAVNGASLEFPLETMCRGALHGISSRPMVEPQTTAQRSSSANRASNLITLSREVEVAYMIENRDRLLAELNVTQVEKDGRVVGLTSSNISKVEIARKLGFRDNDILTSINNDPVNSLKAVDEIFAKYRKAVTCRVGILRDDKPMYIIYRLNP